MKGLSDSETLLLLTSQQHCGCVLALEWRNGGMEGEGKASAPSQARRGLSSLDLGCPRHQSSGCQDSNHMPQTAQAWAPWQCPHVCKFMVGGRQTPRHEIPSLPRGRQSPRAGNDAFVHSCALCLLSPSLFPHTLSHFTFWLGIDWAPHPLLTCLCPEQEHTTTRVQLRAPLEQVRPLAEKLSLVLQATSQPHLSQEKQAGGEAVVHFA